MLKYVFYVLFCAPIGWKGLGLQKPEFKKKPNIGVQQEISMQDLKGFAAFQKYL